MLKHGLWRETEPRLNFPIFGDAENHIDLSLQPGAPIGLRKLAAPIYHYLKKRKKTWPTCVDYINILTNPPYQFRGCFVDRQGKLLHYGELPGNYRPGDYFHCNVNEWLRSAGVNICDGGFILISSRGRNDLWNSSPGNVSLRVVTDRYIAGYRTGFFARTLNAAKGHAGFTGLNPQVTVNEKVVTGILLINHSSEPEYDKTVCPVVRLYRSAAEWLEAPFGDIPPHAALERSVVNLFPNAAEFLRETGGRGVSITSAKGATLASIHVLRTPAGELMSLEHSRPAHPNIVDYL